MSAALRLRVLFTLVFAPSLILTACEKGSEPVVIEEPHDSIPDLVLTNGLIIDGSGRQPIAGGTVFILGETITAVGPDSLIAIPDGTEVIDVHGAAILPGFINAHVHGGFVESHLKAWARAGVTTVRDLGGPAWWAWKEDKAKDPLCARLVAAGPMVSVPGGYPKVPWNSSAFLPVTSPDDARTRVAGLLEDGADIIKLAMESGQEFQMTIPSLSPEEALATVEIAHQHGTIASAHALVTTDLARAIKAGVDDIAHMTIDSLPDSLVLAMVREGIIWVPTLELWYHVGYGRLGAATKNLRKFVEAGGTVALGTDYEGYNAVFQLGMPIHEMEWMIQAGMSPMQVIVAGTRNAAVTCNLSDSIGTIEAGKRANILVVQGNPLDDIRNLSNARLVIHNGTVIRRDSI